MHGEVLGCGKSCPLSVLYGLHPLFFFISLHAPILTSSHITAWKTLLQPKGVASLRYSAVLEWQLEASATSDKVTWDLTLNWDKMIKGKTQ